MSEAAEKIDSGQRKIVTFRIADQDYCIDIGLVREIRGWTPTTVLPQSPVYIKGVMNLRGTVLPVVDLAQRLGLGETEPDGRNVIIIAHLGNRTVGLLVQAVSDITSVPQSELKPMPDVASMDAKAFVEGVFTVDDQLIRVIDLKHILPHDEGDRE